MRDVQTEFKNFFEKKTVSQAPSRGGESKPSTEAYVAGRAGNVMALNRTTAPPETLTLLYPRVPNPHNHMYHIHLSIKHQQ